MISQWLNTARRPAIVRRSLKVSFIVGTLLAIINQGSAILAGGLSWAVLVKVLLTYSVPYMVSTYAAVAAALEQENR